MIGKTNGNLYAKTGGTEIEQLVNYVMLYDYGDECTDITGGWTALSMDSSYQSGGTEKTSTHLRTYELSTSNYGQWGLITQKDIDTTNYVGQSWISTLPTCVRPSGYTNSAITGMLDYDSGRVAYNNRFYNYNSGPSRTGLTAANTTKTCVYKLFTNFTGGQGTVSGTTGHRFYVSHNCGAYSEGIIDVYTYHNWIYAQDNWQELCTIVELSSDDYADEAALCADSTALSTILNNENAINLMIKTCTGSFLTAFIASSTALTALENSLYKTIIQANEHWNKFLNMVV